MKVCIVCDMLHDESVHGKTGLCLVMSKWAMDDHFPIFPIKWRANEQLGGGSAPTRKSLKCSWQIDTGQSSPLTCFFLLVSAWSFLFYAEEAAKNATTVITSPSTSSATSIIMIRRWKTNNNRIKFIIDSNTTVRRKGRRAATTAMTAATRA